MSGGAARLMGRAARRLGRAKPVMAAGVAAAFAGSALLSACTVGPDYKRPPAIVPAAYKEQDGWKPSEPRDAVNRGSWWSIYKDPVLDELEKQIDISNQNLKASEAAFREARAVVQEARAAFFPTLTLNGSAQRTGRGGGSASAVSTTGGTSSRASSQTLYSLTLGASWELDVWGRIRRTVESDVAAAQVSAADLALARLSAQAALATDYFDLRVEDELKRLLDDTVAAYARSLQITQNQYAAGTVGKSDVVQAETLLKSTQAQAINVGVARAQLEHAIAILVGKPPADFTVVPAPLATEVPEIPAGVPSALLERRPDIAAAERQMAAANAQIGVAIAAFFPSVTLTGSYGYTGQVLGKLIQAPNSVWSVGPQLAETLFDAGARGAAVDQARAIYDQDIALYRQTVLTSFQQVEDNLAALRIEAEQAAVQEETVRLAQEATRLTLNQYRAGTIAYTTVITAQATELSSEETALTIRENRLTASVALIQALGGGWDSSQLPTREQVEDDSVPDSSRAEAAADAKPASSSGSWLSIPWLSMP